MGANFRVCPWGLIPISMKQWPFYGYPKLLVVSPKSTVGWNRGLTEILQNQLWDGIVGYSIKKWYKNQAIELLSVA